MRPPGLIARTIGRSIAGRSLTLLLLKPPKDRSDGHTYPKPDDTNRGQPRRSLLADVPLRGEITPAAMGSDLFATCSPDAT